MLTRSSSPQPTLSRILRVFSMTARVCSRMSRTTVPSAVVRTPAIELSGRRALVPDTKTKSPARLTCGKEPRGTATLSTTFALLTTLFPVEGELDLDSRAERQRDDADRRTRGWSRDVRERLLPGGVDRRKLVPARREDPRARQ